MGLGLLSSTAGRNCQSRSSSSKKSKSSSSSSRSSRSSTSSSSGRKKRREERREERRKQRREERRKQRREERRLREDDNPVRVINIDPKNSVEQAKTTWVNGERECLQSIDITANPNVEVAGKPIDQTWFDKYFTGNQWYLYYFMYVIGSKEGVFKLTTLKPTLSASISYTSIRQVVRDPGGPWTIVTTNYTYPVLINNDDNSIHKIHEDPIPFSTPTSGDFLELILTQNGNDTRFSQKLPVSTERICML